MRFSTMSDHMREKEVTRGRVAFLIGFFVALAVYVPLMHWLVG